jgi:hypothetical protein
VPDGGGDGRFFFDGEPSLAELAYYVAECRWLRALALKSGMDPDKALPEDILLLSENSEGEPQVKEELERCRRWLDQETKAHAAQAHHRAATVR